MDICYILEKIIDACDMVAHNLKPYMNRTDTIDADTNAVSDEKRLEYIKNLYMDKYMEMMG